MKVTRLKRGYTIKLSDLEMEILDAFESFVTAGDIEESLAFSGPTKAAWTRRMKDREFFLQTDEDRRA